MKNIFCWNFLKIIINVFPLDYKHKFIIAITFLSLAVFRFSLNKLPLKRYKVPTILLEKVSIHTQILFVHCYKFFFIITCSFSVLVENYCVPVYCTCMVLIFYPFTQIFIIGHKGTIFSQNKNSVSECIFFSVSL